MISFYPGPSQVYKKIPKYTRDAYEEGILGINHRSKEFIKLSKKTISLLHEKLNIPSDYSVFFVSSATESWEIIAQSLIKNRSIHVFSGAFGAKWYNYTKHLHPDSIGISFNEQKALDINSLQIYEDYELLALTHNETSNGTFLKTDLLAAARRQHKGLIAVDATSSLGGLEIDFETADVWFASVQKCLGLPAGMGLMICSPKAIAKAMDLNETGRYNDLTSMIKHMENYQTPYTPNVLSIYLLYRVLEDRKGIKSIARRLRKRNKLLSDALERVKTMQFYISDPLLRSPSVICLKSSPKKVEAIKRQAKKAGFTLGNGYGDLKPYTFRIANFPAITEKQMDKLISHLKSNWK
jgi:phosphoserine aminotransferase